MTLRSHVKNIFLNTCDFSYQDSFQTTRGRVAWTILPLWTPLSTQGHRIFKTRNIRSDKATNHTQKYIKSLTIRHSPWYPA